MEIVASAPPQVSAFETLPVGLFGSVMGLTGLSIAWHLAHERFGISSVISDVVGATAVIAFIAIAFGYVVKVVVAPAGVRAEFEHPIAGSLFGTILISLLLLPVVLASINITLARSAWLVGAIGMTGFGWFTVDRWMNRRQQPAHAAPTWIVPVVGMLDVPLAVPSLGLPSLHGVMVLGLAVGLFFTVPLFTMIFSRLIFEAPLADSLQPSLMILLAPFAVGTSAYIATTGRVDLLAELLFALTLFMLVVLLGRLRHLAACCPFRVSWWAVSFPLAAAAIAAFRVTAADPGRIQDVLAIALLALATIVILGLLSRTIVGLVRGELRTLST